MLHMAQPEVRASPLVSAFVNEVLFAPDSPVHPHNFNLFSASVQCNMTHATSYICTPMCLCVRVGVLAGCFSIRQVKSERLSKRSLWN